MKNIKFIAFFFFLSFSIFALPQPSDIDPAKLIYEKLDQKIDLNLSFTDQEGHKKTLHDLLKNKKALVLTLNYFRCTTMCTYQFLNLANVLSENNFNLKSNYAVASISFDPTDTVAKAKQTHDIWVSKAGAQPGEWAFMVGEAQNISSLTKQLNFYYEKDDEGNYSHAGALFFIAPDGTFVRYLYGIVYDKSDVTFALVDTSKGAVGSLYDKFLKLFKKYDATRGRYVWQFSH